MTKLEINKDILKLSKVDLAKSGAIHAQELIQSGHEDATVILAKARKAVEYLNHFIQEATPHALNMVDGQVEVDTYGVIMSTGHTGDRLDYEQDQIYSELKEALQFRKDCIDLATRKAAGEPVYDNDGVAIPTVGIKTPSKQVLKCRIR